MCSVAAFGFSVERKSSHDRRAIHQAYSLRRTLRRVAREQQGEFVAEVAWRNAVGLGLWRRAAGPQCWPQEPNDA